MRVALFLPLLLSTTALAEIKLATGFTSNMVLQRDLPARIAGFADSGEKVSIHLGQQLVAETLGKGASEPWSVELPVQKAGPIPDIIVKGVNTVVLTNLLAGDVWVCSGQSNMEMTLKGINAQAEIAEAKYPQIRLFTALAKEPWSECTPEKAAQFSAVGYFFGRELHKQLTVPIGLVFAAAGGTRAESWTPPSATANWPEFAANLEEAKKLHEQLAPLGDADARARAEYYQQSAEAKKQGQPAPPMPTNKLTSEQADTYREVSSLVKLGSIYKSRIAPFNLHRIKGVTWYQGESNANSKLDYAGLLERLITGWRNDWGQGDFPFLIVQLANFGANNGFAEIRLAQEEVSQRVPNSFMSVAMDIGDAKNIHPKNKQEVGRRLALLALKHIYNKDLVASGPRFKEAKFDGPRVNLSFDVGTSDQQLTLRAGERSAFELAGADGVFKPAAAVVNGCSIELSSPEVSDPRAARYAWAEAASLFNSAGLPAAPFQTDNWAN